MAKKEIVLHPKKEIKEDYELKISPEKLLQQLESNNLIEDSQENSDSFFKAVINHLLSDKEISTKTEYLNVKENFAGAKLHFLAKHGNIPYLSDFIEIFERKRVSLQRKGRKELLLALKERQQEIEREKQMQLSMLGGMT